MNMKSTLGLAPKPTFQNPAPHAGLCAALACSMTSAKLMLCLAPTYPFKHPSHVSSCCTTCLPDDPGEAHAALDNLTYQKQEPTPRAHLLHHLPAS
jgi:hypothetical protein